MLTMATAEFVTAAVDAAMAQLRIEMGATAKETYDNLGKKIDDINKLMKDLEEQVKKSDDGQGGSRSKFNHKGARDLRPGHWDDKLMFSDLSMDIRTWARTLHEDFLDLIDMAEKQFVETGEFQTAADITASLYPDFAQIDLHLYNMLVTTVKGNAKIYVQNESESGFQAWAQMIQHFDPRGTVDSTVAYGRLVNPVPHFGQASTTDQIRQVMQKWESEMQQFERKFGKKVDEDAKKLGRKSLMPNEMFGENGSFRGKKLGSYQDLRKAILQYLEDKPIPTAGKSQQNWRTWATTTRPRRTRATTTRT